MLASVGVAHAQEASTRLPQISVEGDGAADETGDNLVAKTSDTGSKISVPLTEVPQSISVVTRKQIEEHGALTVGQALRYTPGLVAEPGGGNESLRYDFQSLRGLPYVGSHFVDGLKATFGVGNLGMPQFDPYNIERIDVVRGPTSVLYGQGYPGGMINIVTKKPTSERLREVAVGVGNDGKLFGTFDFSGPLDAEGQFLYRLTGVGRRADNQVDLVGEERLAIAPSFTWKPSDNTSLTILGSFQRDPEGGFYGSLPEAGLLYPLSDGEYIPRNFFPGDPDFDRFEREQASIGYGFEHRFNEHWKISQNLRYIDSSAEVQALSALQLIPPTTLARAALYGDDRTRALTVDTNAEVTFTTGPLAHTMLAGVDYARSVWDQEFGFSAMVPPIDIRNPIYGSPIQVPDSPATAMVFSSTRQKQEQIGVYLQDQVRWGNLVLTAGGRYDSADLFSDRKSSFLGMDTSGSSDQKDDAFSGRVGLTYLFENGLAPYVSYSTSFVPTLGTGADGVPFRPIRGEQWEAGIKYEPNRFDGFFAASVFDVRLENALTTDTRPGRICMGQMGPGPCQIQSGEQRFRGLELEAKAQLSSGLSVLGAYTYLDAEITRSNGPDLGKRPVNTPEHIASLWLNYSFQNQTLLGLTIGGGIRHQGATFGDPENTNRVPAHTLFDASVRYDFGQKFKDLEGLELAVNATNLFDETYVACSGKSYCNYGAGRSVVGTLSYRW
ncbi:TonB-dependent siderophore receptor [Nitratireductor aquibiodomus]|nr:TonB-dependent siderophore receptor [Nitratireductor aquibiodomus]